MSRKTIYFPHSYIIFAILLLILIVAAGLIFVGVIGAAFRDVGFSPAITVLILVATFAGSLINIPLMRLRAKAPRIKEEAVNFFGILYRIPQVKYDETVTVLAVNVGDAFIPTAVSLYLVWKAPANLLYCLAGVAVVALITRVVARPVKGVGIVTPAFIPPIAAAAIAYILLPGSPKIVAYVSGTLGTLIGADLSNLNIIPKIGAPMASMGGAGTFDGIFLSGIIATLLA